MNLQVLKGPGGLRIWGFHWGYKCPKWGYPTVVITLLIILLTKSLELVSTSMESESCAEAPKPLKGLGFPDREARVAALPPSCIVVE